MYNVLSLCYIILTFNNPVQEAFSRKKENTVTNVISFSRVFYPTKDKLKSQ